MSNLYHVVKDYQGGSFGMGRIMGAQDWLKQACNWLDDNGSSAETIQAIASYYKDELSKGHEHELMNYIAEVWDLEIEEVGDEDVLLGQYKKSVKRGKGAPSFEDWLTLQFEEKQYAQI